MKVKRIPAIEKNYAVQTSGKRDYIDFIASENLQFYALFCVQIWTCFSIKIKLRLFCEKKEKKRKKKIDTKNILDPVLAFKDFPDCFFPDRNSERFIKTYFLNNSWIILG